MTKLGPYELYNIIHGDCLEIMPEIPDSSIDAIIADWPYGVTNCKWDSVIPLEPLWKECKRVIKPRGAIVLTASQPFTSVLVMSNLGWFRYSLVWDKKVATGFLDVKKRPMKAHEDVCVFYESLPTYNPQMITRTEDELKRLSYKSTRTRVTPSVVFNGYYGPPVENQRERIQKYPSSVIRIAGLHGQHPERTGHPTQKPVALLEYLIKTYTNPGDLILDNTMGSGSTGEAAIRTGRRFIGIEKDEGYFEIAKQRLKNVELETKEPVQLEMIKA